MLKQLKKTVLKEVKEGVMKISHHIENIRDRNYKKELKGKSEVEKFN